MSRRERKEAARRARFGREPLFQPHELARVNVPVDLEWERLNRRAIECLRSSAEHDAACLKALDELPAIRAQLVEGDAA